MGCRESSVRQSGSLQRHVYHVRPKVRSWEGAHSSSSTLPSPEHTTPVVCVLFPFSLFFLKNNSLDHGVLGEVVSDCAALHRVILLFIIARVIGG